jgi:hypothetical protein
VASDLAIGDLHWQWDFEFAALIPVSAPGMECATTRRVDWISRLALDWPAHATPNRLEIGHRVEQHLRIGVTWPIEQLIRWRQLDQPSQIKNANVACHVANNCKVVADE